MMNAGELQQKIQFVEFNRVSDGKGGFVPGAAPTVVVDTHARIKQIKASRTAENLQTQLNTVYELKLRKRPSFQPKTNQNIRWDGEDFNIIEIVEDVKDQQYWLITITGRGTGL